ncbi:hypothetical protein PIROE2DRAFT_4332 [Piromyces sp. E2]|nr:hypothetical protein PIROE2DRAFT_4332 [Piromyces sp. E2]|eukprot:OUM68049.1 hypothetical protein PIROE2DRAFT_4332 [Piromyces sp. E2]
MASSNIHEIALCCATIICHESGIEITYENLLKLLKSANITEKGCYDLKHILDGANNEVLPIIEKKINTYDSDNTDDSIMEMF